jgi:DNA-binding transcriptional ArsR family regulator
MSALEALATQLRAVADERRLRLLRLCADGPASVSALAAASADSEPNVSRQLKQLAGAGLVQRTRQGQFVEYAVASGEGQEARLVQWLLARLADDPASQGARLALQRARQAEAARGGAGRGPLAPSRFGRALAAALLPSDAAGLGRVVLRCRHPELLAALVSRASEAVLLATSAGERAALRRWAAAQGVGAEVALAAALLARAGAPRWDLVVLDEAGPARSGPVGALEADLELARRLLAPQGRAWLMADYDALEAVAGGVAPPRRLRALMLAAGLECQELLPVESGGRHVLVARSAASRAAAPLARSA